MEEIFKSIPLFSDYEISNLGRVRTKKRKIRYTHSITKNEHFRETTERFLKIHFNNLSGYKFVQLYSKKKMFNKTIHRLVAETFISKSEFQYFDVVNHKDGNKHNNIAENLEWCTDKYNHEHATITGLKAKGDKIGSSKLNDNAVCAIKYFLNKGLSHSELSIAFNISRPTISLIAEGKAWKHISITGEELTLAQ